MAPRGDERVVLKRIYARAYTIPTDTPEADGTFQWNATTLIVVHVEGGGRTGVGYTYTDGCIVSLIEGKLSEVLKDADAMDPPAAWCTMQQAVRNMGRMGLTATAISAIDTALWDLKAKLHGKPLCMLLGRFRNGVPIYGSGGFTTYSDEELRDQLSGWVERDGCRWVKMKVGAHPERDPHRVETAKQAIGDHTLFVDGNGAYSVKQALRLADQFAQQRVTWFEEPVSSDDLDGLQIMRRRVPPAMEIAAGEYGYDVGYFRRMLNAQAVDVLQADITRCGGVTAFLQVAALCNAHFLDLSGHCAPSLHLHAACAVPRFRHLEWFHDHVRIEHMLFDGAPKPRNGMIAPDLSRPGIGLEFKEQDAENFAVS
jgi:L-alanine-DL-glutamate epimerase-like enolase superfamily enzyme